MSDSNNAAQGLKRTRLVVARNTFSVKAVGMDDNSVKWTATTGEYLLYLLGGAAASTADSSAKDEEPLPQFVVSQIPAASGSGGQTEEILMALEPEDETDDKSYPSSTDPLSDVLWSWRVPSTALTVAAVRGTKLLFRRNLFGPHSNRFSGVRHKSNTSIDVSNLVFAVNATGNGLRQAQSLMRHPRHLGCRFVFQQRLA